jgi:hypothetical protein
MAGERSYTAQGATLVELERAASDRLADAEALAAAGRHASAIAMGLYAVELHLKAAICRKLDVDALPTAFEIHNLNGLLLLAGLTRKIARKRSHHALKNWGLVLKQSNRLNDLRYKPEADLNIDAAEVTAFLGQLRDPPHRVLPWLSRQR